MRVPSWWPEGYDRPRPSADGSEAWTARERDSGATVALRPLPAGSDVRSIARDPGRAVVIGPKGWVLVTVTASGAGSARARPPRGGRFIAVMTVVVLAAVGGLASAHTAHTRHTLAMPTTPTQQPQQPTPVPTASATPSPAVASSAHTEVWWRVLAGLDRRRSEAFQVRDRHLLVRVYVPGSALLRADRHTIALLRHDGLRPRGLRLRLISVRFVNAQHDRVRLRVTDVLPAYVFVPRDGHVVHRPGRGERRWLVQLTRIAGAWRIASERRI